jgi:hypothetical protein
LCACCARLLSRAFAPLLCQSLLLLSALCACSDATDAAQKKMEKKNEK